MVARRAGGLGRESIGRTGYTMAERDLTRRRFVAAGAGALALGAASLRRVRGANERLNLGVIGCGGRAGSLMNEVHRCYDELNVALTAVCDVWRPNRERGAARMTEWGAGEVRQFSRYADLLALDDLDGVIIATPDFAHSPILAAAARAGKHAYCEKPMATRIEDARAAVDAVREHGTIVQIGTQRRSEGRWKGAVKLIQAGTIGQVTQIDSAWHDSGSRWSRGFGDVNEDDVDWAQYQMDLEPRPFDPRRYRCWHLYLDYTNGTPGLLGAHLIDSAVWCMDDPLPTSCVAHGGTYVWQDREHCDTMECLYEYPRGFLLSYSTRLGNSANRAENVFYGTRGVFDSSTWTATGEGGGRDKLAEPVRVTDEPSENHMRNWLECIRAGRDPNAPVEAGFAHSVAAIMADQSWRQGRRMVYDAATRDLGAG